VENRESQWDHDPAHDAPRGVECSECSGDATVSAVCAECAVSLLDEERVCLEQLERVTEAVRAVLAAQRAGVEARTWRAAGAGLVRELARLESVMRARGMLPSSAASRLSRTPHERLEEAEARRDDAALERRRLEDR
jgi:hypothetical protein